MDQAVPLGFRAERSIKTSGSPGLLCSEKVELIRRCDAWSSPPVGRCPIHCVVKVCTVPPDKLVRLSVAINMVRALASGLPRTVVKVKLIKRISCGASSCDGHNPALCKADLHKIPVAHEAAS